MKNKHRFFTLAACVLLMGFTDAGGETITIDTLESHTEQIIGTGPEFSLHLGKDSEIDVTNAPTAVIATGAVTRVTADDGGGIWGVEKGIVMTGDRDDARHELSLGKWSFIDAGERNVAGDTVFTGAEFNRGLSAAVTLDEDSEITAFSSRGSGNKRLYGTAFNGISNVDISAGRKAHVSAGIHMPVPKPPDAMMDAAAVSVGEARNTSISLENDNFFMGYALALDGTATGDGIRINGSGGDSRAAILMDREARVEGGAMGRDALARGISITDTREAVVRMGQDTRINGSALSAAPESRASAFGLTCENVGGSLSLTMDQGAAITADAGDYTTNEDAAGDNRATGVKAEQVRETRIHLDHGSEISARAASCTGVHIFESSLVEIELDNGSAIKASGSGNGFHFTMGLFLRDVENSRLELRNGAAISAEADGMGTGIFISEGSQSTIFVDAASSISGHWAVFSWGNDTSLDNAGLLKGALEVETLTNRSTGRLRPIISGNGATELQGGLSEASPYYTVSGVATLENGTTLAPGSRNNFGLTQWGDTREFYLLSSGSGAWDTEALTLETASPLLGLSWSPLSNANNLVLRTILKSPENAGISQNGARAARAALDAGILDFESSPEEWYPGINGALLMGGTAGLGALQRGLERRTDELRHKDTATTAETGWGLWMEMDAERTFQDGRGHLPGFDADTLAMTFGLDARMDGITLGGALTLSDTDTDSDRNRETVDSEDHLVTLYGSLDTGAWFNDLDLSFGKRDLDIIRRVGERNHAAQTRGQVLSAGARTGFAVKGDGYRLAPSLHLRYTRQTLDNYTETGEDKALIVDGTSHETLDAGAGFLAALSGKTALANLDAEIRGRINYDLIGDRLHTRARFSEAPETSAFDVFGPSPKRTSWDAGASLTFSSPRGLPVSLRLSCDYRGRKDSDAFALGARFRFDF